MISRQHLYRIYVRRNYIETWEVKAPTALTARRRLREFFMNKDSHPEGVPDGPSDEAGFHISLKGWEIERVD